MNKLATRSAMPIYRKNVRVRLERFERAGFTTRGQPAGNWVQVTDLWANVQPLTTRTAEAAHQVWSQATHRIYIDFREDVDTHCRIVWGTRNLAIGHVADLDAARVTLELLCSETLES